MRFSKEFTLSSEDFWRGVPVGGSRGMSRTEAELSLSPASDCNSNTVDTSYASNTSDLEFIQDNSDYQWCTDYGYREVGVTHRSVLSSCYDELARDLDSQLAQVDMEDYSAQEILSTLPAICCPVSQPTDLSLQGERQGEMFASVSGSLMVKFDFDSSISPHTSSQDEESSMSLCQSELLFSPVKEQQLPTYSVDSLDEGDQLIVTCQANKTNYTIAFHASTVLGEGDQEGGGSVYTENGESMISSVDEREESKMAASDAPTTTWSKLRRGSRVGRARSKTISLPDLGHDQRPQLSNPPPPSIISSGGCVKLFDIQKSGSGSSYGELLGDVSPSPPPARQASAPTSNFSLLRMFIAQRANSADHYMDNSRFNVNNNNSIEREGEREEKRSTATTSAGSGVSELSAPTSSGPTPQTRLCPLHLVDRAIQTSVREAKEPAQNQPLRVTPSQEKTGDDKKPVYVLYPNYTLPDLGFLRGGPPAERILLAPVKYSPRSPGTPPSLVGTGTPPHRPLTRKDLDYLRQKGVDHVMDWSSLAPLLPSEYWSLLCELPQVRQYAGSRLDKPAFAISTNSSKDISTPPPNFGGKTTSNSSECSSGTAPSSGYRGSSTILSEVESGGVGPANTPANPLYVYNYMEEGSSKKAHDRKRYSMFEFGGLEENLENDPKGKRRSYPAQMHKEREEEEERCDGERWEDWWRDSAKRPHSPPSAHAHRLDQLLELSGGGELSWHWQPHDVKQLRDQVKEEDYCEVKQYPEEVCRSRYDFTHKKRLVERVLGGVEKVMSAVETMERAGMDLSGAAQAEELARTVLDSLCPPIYSLLSDGLRPRLDTAFGPISNSVWQLVEASAHQGPMTKALHELVMKLNSEDILSEGLIKFNAFIFGLLNVHGTDAWVSYLRTRESILSKHYTEESVLLSASRGHAKARALTESLIAGLRPLAALNFRLDLLFETRLLHQSLLQLAKLPLSPSSTYDVTSDSQLLKKIVQSIRSGLSGGNTSTEEISEVSLDRRGGRPRSCVDPGTVQTQDIAATQRKRWSTVHVGSRLVNAYDRLNLTSPTSQDINKISDSGSKSSGSDNSPELEEDGQKTGGKFRSLQRKWELLSGKSQDKSRLPRSRIPRPVTSPVRPVTMRAPTPASLQRRALSSIPTHRSRSKDGIEPEKTPAVRRPKTTSGGRPPAPGQKKTPAKSSIPRSVLLHHQLARALS